MKLKLLIILTFFVSILQAQNTSQRTNGTVTVVDPNLFTTRSFRVPVYEDTIQANTQFPTLDSVGKIIYTRLDNKLKYRGVGRWYDVSNSGYDSTRTNTDSFAYRRDLTSIDSNGNLLLGSLNGKDTFRIVGGGTGIVKSIVAGTNVTVDATDPANPIVSATGGGGSTGWSLTGNSGTDESNYIGTNDLRGVGFYTDGVQRMRLDSLGNLTVPTSYFLMLSKGATQTGALNLSENFAILQSGLNDGSQGGSFSTYPGIVSMSMGNPSFQTQSLEFSPSEGMVVYDRYNHKGLTAEERMYNTDPYSYTQKAYVDSLAKVSSGKGPLVSKTSAYTVTLANHAIKCDATSGAFNITLLTAVGNQDVEFTIKKVDASGNAVTIVTTSGQTIDGASTYSLSAQWKWVTVKSDGTQWLIFGNN